MSKSLPEIDRHPLTFQALDEKGSAQLQDQRQEEAEATLRWARQIQGASNSVNDDELAKTRNRLVKLLKEQGRFPEIKSQPKSQRVQFGDAATLSVEGRERRRPRFRLPMVLCWQADQGRNRIDLFDSKRIGERSGAVSRRSWASESPFSFVTK